MKKEFKVRSMPIGYYVLFFCCIAVAAGITVWFQGYGWVAFMAPLLVSLQGMSAKIIIDKGYLFVKGGLIPQQRVKIAQIRKVKVHPKTGLMLITPRSFVRLDPAAPEELILALKAENADMDIEKPE